MELYVASSGSDIVKYLSIYALEGKVNPTTLTYNNKEPLGDCLGTLKVADSSEYNPLRFDITEYLREHINNKKQYMSIGVEIDEDWQRQIYPLGHYNKENFIVIIKNKSTTGQEPKIILY